LKKNELEFKRNMVELRDSIKNNWATTGQELTKDFRQFWQSSRPASPARTPTRERTERDLAATATSPSVLSHLSHLEIPGRPSERGSSEFAAGYNLGLIGGVRSWVSTQLLCRRIGANIRQMARSRRNLNDSRPPSPYDEDSPDEHMETSAKETPRGRSGKQSSEAMDAQL
jgi:choline-phosphate cytidylyltransferase